MRAALCARTLGPLLAAAAASCAPDPGGPSSGRAVATRSDGAWVVTGRFERSLRLPGRAAVASQGRRDLFVVCYSAAGKVAWARSAGGLEQDEGWDVAALADGSALVTGEFQGSAVFERGDGSAATIVSSGEADVFLALYDARGSLRWVRSAGGRGQDLGRAAAALPDGAFVVVGRFEDEIVFARSEPGERRVASRGARDSFVAKLTPDGQIAWLVTLGGPGEAYAQDVTTLGDGSCLIVGSFQRTIAVGDPAAGGLVLESAGDDDIFVCQLAPDGTPLWARAAGGAGEDSAHGVAALPDGACLVTGRFGGSATFGPGEPGEVRCTAAGDRDAFLARFDGDGNMRWVRSAGGPGSDYGRAVATRPDGTCLLTGYFRDTAVFGPGEKNEIRLASDGELDVFIARLDANGRLLEACRFGHWGSERSNGLATFEDGSFVLAGERPASASMFEEELLVARLVDLTSLP